MTNAFLPLSSGCVVYGRVSGDSAAAHLLQNSKAADRLGAVAGHLIETKVKVDPSSSKVTLEFSWDGASSPSSSSSSAAPSTSTPAAAASSTPAPAAPAAAAASSAPEEKSAGEYSLADVAKHNTEKDIWVVVNDQVRTPLSLASCYLILTNDIDLICTCHEQVLDVTSFLPEHPGGAKAILLYAGKDATEEFNMLHDPKVIPRYAPNAIIGTLKK